MSELIKETQINNCISVEKYGDGSICIKGRYANDPGEADNIWLVKEDAKKLFDALHAVRETRGGNGN